MPEERVGKVADQNPPVVESLIDPFAVPVRWCAEKEIGLGGDDIVAEGEQFRAEPFPGGADALDAGAEIALVLEGCGGRRLGEAVEVVVVADLVEGGDARRRADGQAALPARE